MENTDGDRLITDEMDKCFAVLLASPSQKTAETARRLEELVKEYRGYCADVLLKNIATVSQTIVSDLKKFGIILLSQEEAEKCEKEGMKVHK